MSTQPPRATDAQLIQAAQAYANCTDLQTQNRTLYDELKRRNLYDTEVRAFLRSKNNPALYAETDNASLLVLAQKYQGRTELTQHDQGLREELERRGLWEVALPRRRKKWTLQAVSDEAQKYKTSLELSQNNFAAYHWAVKNGLIPELYPACVTEEDAGARKWTRETITEIAKRCHNRTEFHGKYPGAYAAARSLGIMEEVCAHMQTTARRKSPSGMSNAELFQAASKFNTPNEFLRGNRSAYIQAVRRGIYARIAAKYGWV